MRKFVFITGALSISMSGVGTFLKVFHIPFGLEILILSILLFSVVFVPSAAIYYYKKGK
jgi:hypothetical protein